MGVADRFWAKVDVGAASGCWRWNGAHERISKRGLFCFEGR